MCSGAGDTQQALESCEDLENRVTEAADNAQQALDACEELEGDVNELREAIDELREGVPSAVDA